MVLPIKGKQTTSFPTLGWVGFQTPISKVWGAVPHEDELQHFAYVYHSRVAESQQAVLICQLVEYS